jgi:ABC-type transporter Mla maintaining outer membrane lipid asymmetry ATPase subunit MlaF
VVTHDIATVRRVADFIGMLYLRNLVQFDTMEAHLEVLRIDVEMVHTSSGWMVDRVTLLQTPSGFPSGSG